MKKRARRVNVHSIEAGKHILIFSHIQQKSREDGKKEVRRKRLLFLQLIFHQRVRCWEALSKAVDSVKYRDLK